MAKLVCNSNPHLAFDGRPFERAKVQTRERMKVEEKLFILGRLIYLALSHKLQGCEETQTIFDNATVSLIYEQLLLTIVIEQP